MPGAGAGLRAAPRRPRASAPTRSSCATTLQDELDRAATHAFAARSGRRRVRARGAARRSPSRAGGRSCERPTALVAAVDRRLAASALVGVYLALGRVELRADARCRIPCEPREWRSPDGIEESAEQFTLSALDGAACELQVSRETLAVALADRGVPRRQFAEEYGIDDAQLEAAVRPGSCGRSTTPRKPARSPARRRAAARVRQPASRRRGDRADRGRDRRLRGRAGASSTQGEGLLEEARGPPRCDPARAVPA